MTKQDKIEKLFDILQIHDMLPYPNAAKESGIGYTDYICRAHKHAFNTDPKTGKEYTYSPDRNRQCTIGYHEECSDPEGETCGCPCHQIIKLL